MWTAMGTTVGTTVGTTTCSSSTSEWMRFVVPSTKPRLSKQWRKGGGWGTPKRKATTLAAECCWPQRPLLAVGAFPGHSFASLGGIKADGGRRRFSRWREPFVDRGCCPPSGRQSTATDSTRRQLSWIGAPIATLLLCDQKQRLKDLSMKGSGW